MSDALVLRSAIDLMDSATVITWSNKYICPSGYNYNDDGYVITNEPRAMIRSCIGLSFSFLVRKLGVREYIRQNAIVLRLLNEKCHKAIVTAALWNAFRRAGFNIDRAVYDEVMIEVYGLTSVPEMNSNFITYRRTWFSASCSYDTVSKIVRLENSNKIDSDRELMTIDKKYITSEVAEFTGFSRSRIDRYWSDKSWTKKLRTLYTLDEAVESLAKKGILDPTRSQLALESGLHVDTISRSMKDIKKMIAEANKALQANNNDLFNNIGPNDSVGIMPKGWEPKAVLNIDVNKKI